jgi:hypothetical protein
VGNVKIRYYVTRKAWPGSRATWGYWIPTKKMKALGFSIVRCGEDGPEAWAVAHRWNARWDKLRRGESIEIETQASVHVRIFPQGSLGQAFNDLRRTNTWEMGKKARTKEDWWRGWALIETVFGDVDPRTVTLMQLDDWYAALLETKGVREAHRAMKIWRALWRVAAALKYCERDADPSLGIRRKTPTPRNAIWYEGEAVRLVKAAIRMRYYGLAAALAVAWDTMLSPVDVRTLTRAQMRGDGEGSLFALARAKTGKAAIGTLGKRAQRVLDAYLATLPPDLIPTAPIFYTRGGKSGPKGGRPRPPVPYTADTLGDDFRELREAVFPGDRRTVMDFRRSGAIEAAAGQVDPAALAGKMANTIDQSRELQATYLPGQTAVVKLADAARVKGRARLRGANEPGSKS